MLPSQPAVVNSLFVKFHQLGTSPAIRISLLSRLQSHPTSPVDLALFPRDLLLETLFNIFLKAGVSPRVTEEANRGEMFISVFNRMIVGLNLSAADRTNNER